MSWKEELLLGERSFEDFYNCTVGKQFTENHLIDPMMTGIIKSLNAEGLYTISCCEGHHSYRNATVAFSSNIPEIKILQFMLEHNVPLTWFSLSSFTKPIYLNNLDSVFTAVRMDIKAYYKVQLLEMFKEV